MLQINKNKPIRDPKYLKAICAYGCVITGREAIPHHLKGYKQGGGKVDDYLTFPLNDEYHSAAYETGLHKNYKKWEKKHGLQVTHIKDTLNRAVIDGFISVKDCAKAYQICSDLETRFRS